MIKKNLTPEQRQERNQRLANYKGVGEVISFEAMEKIAEENYKRVASFKSSLPTLDKLLGGFEAGELVVVSGITGQGKTTLCQTLGYNFWKNGNKTSTWFSYEVSPYHFLRKFPELPKSFMPESMEGNTVEWLEERIIESKLKYEANIVFIDHLHFLLSMKDGGMNPSMAIGGIVRELKQIAVTHNLLVFLIAHTTKARFGGGEELGLGSVRDSSFIEQEADSVLYVWRNIDKGVPENMSKLKIAKNRKLGIVDRTIDLRYDNKLLLEVSKDEYTPPPTEEELAEKRAEVYQRMAEEQLNI